MVSLNKVASRIARTFHVHACSDVTGFGLLGHAAEMAMGSGVTIELDSGKLPVLPGAQQLAQNGFLTGGCHRNRAYLEDKVIIDRNVRADLLEVVFDPQTSGGLLIALPEKHAGNLVKKLRAAGIKSAAVVGRARGKREAWVYLA